MRDDAGDADAGKAAWVRFEAELPRELYTQLQRWGKEIGCGPGFVLWAIMADTLDEQAERFRPRVEAAYAELQQREQAQDEG